MVLRRLKVDQRARSWAELVNMIDDTSLMLSPPYQRGDVWTATQRRALIESVLTGLPIASLIFNRRDEWPGYRGQETWFVCVDGKQRLTTLWMWMKDQVEIPVTWVRAKDLECASHKEAVVWSDLTPSAQREMKRTPIACSEAQMPDLETEIWAYEQINWAGTAHTDEDKARMLRAKEDL